MRKLACRHAEHPLASKRAVTAVDLVEEPIVSPWEIYSDELVEYWLGEFRPDGRRPGDPHGRSLEECLALVTQGAAIFCVPQSVERLYPRSEIVFRPIIDVAPAEVAVGWHRVARNPAVHAFVETARDVVTPPPRSRSPLISAAARSACDYVFHFRR